MHTSVTSRKATGRLGREVQNKIGQQLRAMYDDVVRQGVPSRFEKLLRRLDDAPRAEPADRPEHTEKGSG